MEVVVVLSSRIGIFVNGSFNVIDSKEEDDDVKSSFFYINFQWKLFMDDWLE